MRGYGNKRERGSRNDKEKRGFGNKRHNLAKVEFITREQSVALRGKEWLKRIGKEERGKNNK